MPAGVVLPLENQMKTPADMKVCNQVNSSLHSFSQGWNGVLNTSMVMVSCLYIAVGFFGYLKYGEVIRAFSSEVVHLLEYSTSTDMQIFQNVTGSITLNLPVGQL